MSKLRPDLETAINEVLMRPGSSNTFFAGLFDSKLPPEVDRAFLDLGNAQRGAPEAAMVEAQLAIGGGVLGGLIEHVGDLTHRMTTAHPRSEAGADYVRDKVGLALRR